MGRRLGIVISGALFVSGCMAPPPQRISLDQALLQETGYELGPENPAHGIDGAECAAESRYHGEAGPVLVLVCVAPFKKERGRIRYRINYSPPAAGHRIWKIDASLPDRKLQDLGMIEELESKYGPARKAANGQIFTWHLEAGHLEIEEDRYGVQITLWDRSLRQS
ncbi:MAG: hypothetical protein WDZ54_06305 [Sneathiella sp.]